MTPTGVFCSFSARSALGLADAEFDKIFDEIKEKHRATMDTELIAEALAEVVERFKDLIKTQTGRPFPQDPWAQLFFSMEGVFKSWMGKRAVDYRRQFNITPIWPTAPR